MATISASRTLNVSFKGPSGEQKVAAPVSAEAKEINAFKDAHGKDVKITSIEVGAGAHVTGISIELGKNYKESEVDKDRVVDLLNGLKGSLTSLSITYDKKAEFAPVWDAGERSLENLKTLTFTSKNHKEGMQFDDGAIEGLAKAAPNLNSLEYDTNSEGTPTSLNKLTHLKELTVIFDGRAEGQRKIDSISGITCLETLHVYGSGIERAPGAMLSATDGLASLKELEIKDSSKHIVYKAEMGASIADQIRAGMGSGAFHDYTKSLERDMKDMSKLSEALKSIGKDTSITPAGKVARIKEEFKKQKELISKHDSLKRNMESYEKIKSLTNSSSNAHKANKTLKSKIAISIFLLNEGTAASKAQLDSIRIAPKAETDLSKQAMLPDAVRLTMGNASFTVNMLKTDPAAAATQEEKDKAKAYARQLLDEFRLSLKRQQLKLDNVKLEGFVTPASKASAQGPEGITALVTKVLQSDSVTMSQATQVYSLLQQAWIDQHVASSWRRAALSKELGAASEAAAAINSDNALRTPDNQKAYMRALRTNWLHAFSAHYASSNDAAKKALITSAKFTEDEMKSLQKLSEVGVSDQTKTYVDSELKTAAFNSSDAYAGYVLGDFKIGSATWEDIERKIREAMELQLNTTRGAGGRTGPFSAPA